LVEAALSCRGASVLLRQGHQGGSHGRYRVLVVRWHCTAGRQGLLSAPLEQWPAERPTPKWGHSAYKKKRVTNLNYRKWQRARVSVSAILQQIYRSAQPNALLVAVILVYLPLLRNGFPSMIIKMVQQKKWRPTLYPASPSHHPRTLLIFSPQHCLHSGHPRIFKDPARQFLVAAHLFLINAIFGSPTLCRSRPTI